MGLCNFFRHHIQDFSIIAAPLFKLTRQDSGYHSGPLNKEALTAFHTLQDKLTKQPTLAFPRPDQEYLLITNAYIPNQNSPGGLCANLAQRDHLGQIKIISHASRQLRENEKNYTRFLLEAAAAAWGMDNFNEYLKGSRFTLYRDLTTEATLGTTQLKTLNRLRNTMIEHDFQTRDRQTATLPPILKTGQIQHESDPDTTFNKVIHVDLIQTNSADSTLLSITDHTRTLTRLAVLNDDKIDSVATSIWHQWCQPYGNPASIRSNAGKVWTSKLESRLDKLNKTGPRIICRSEKETFFPEVQQQWKQQQLTTSATDFTQNWNFLSGLQTPPDTNSGINDLSQEDSDLDDIEDFVEADTNQDEYLQLHPELGQCKRKQIKLCRHKLQTRAYPRTTEKKARQATLCNLEPDLPNLQQDWLQLIRVEKEIERQKVLLREAEAGNQTETELEDLLFDETDEELGSLDDEDLEWVKSIFNSSPRRTCYSQNPNYEKLKSLAAEDASTRARTVQATPIKFNQNFNQNSMTLSAKEKDFSFHSNTDYEGDSELGDYFSDDEEEHQVAELGDYFSDDEEDDIPSHQSSNSEENFWSHTFTPNSEEKLRLARAAFADWNPVISSLEAFEEKKEPIKPIANFLEETQLGLSTWQPFIPLAPAFQNSAARSQLSAFSSQASSSREPTHIQISTISTSTEPKISQASPHRATSLGLPKQWHLSKPPTRRSTTKWTRPWTGSREACRKSQNWQKRCPDPLEPSNPGKHWTKQPLYLKTTNQIYNINCQTMPPVNDYGGNETPKPEATNLQQQVQSPIQKQPPNGSSTTWPPHYFRSRASPQLEQPYNWHQESNAPNVPRVSTLFKLQTYWNTKPVRSIARTKYWGKRLLKSSIKTPTFRTKSPSTARRHQKNSKRIPSWHWSQKPFLHICSLNTAKTRKSCRKNKICPHGGSHFSKRRSESENTDYHQQGENYDQCQKDNSKNDTQSETDDVTVKSKENTKTIIKFDDEAKMIARDDEVKAMEKTLKEFRARKGKQRDREIDTEASITLPYPFAITFHIPILTFTIFICTFNIFIAIFNSLVADPLDHHSQTFTIRDLSDCKSRHLSQQTASTQADTVVKTLANPDSIRPFKIPGNWSEVHYKSRSRNLLVPSHLLPDRVRKSETQFHSYATT
jgi:hypothetical protein